jgi:acetyl-CoA carboxylase biotin carboxylase subunit
MLIASAETRDDAIPRGRAALAACGIAGVRTTGPFLARVFERAAFRAGRVHTGMVEGGAFDA